MKGIERGIGQRRATHAQTGTDRVCAACGAWGAAARRGRRITLVCPRTTGLARPFVGARVGGDGLVRGRAIAAGAVLAGVAPLVSARRVAVRVVRMRLMRVVRMRIVRMRMVCMQFGASMTIRSASITIERALPNG